MQQKTLHTHNQQPTCTGFWCSLHTECERKISSFISLCIQKKGYYFSFVKFSFSVHYVINCVCQGLQRINRGPCRDNLQNFELMQYNSYALAYMYFSGIRFCIHIQAGCASSRSGKSDFQKYENVGENIEKIRGINICRQMKKGKKINNYLLTITRIQSFCTND